MEERKMIGKTPHVYLKRFGLLLCLFMLSLIVHYSILLTTYHIESSRIKRILDLFINHPHRIEINETGPWNQVKRTNNREILIESSAKVVIILIQSFIQNGFLEIVAVDRESNLLEWQWDYRYVKAQKPGTHWIMTNIPSNLKGAKPFRLFLFYDEKKVTVENIYALEVNSDDDWNELFYNEDFFQYPNGVIEAIGTNGYSVMPIDLNIPMARFDGTG